MEQLISGTVDTQKQSTIALGNTNAGDNTIIELTIKSNGVLLEYDNPTFELLAKKSDNTRVRQIKDITLEEGKIKIKCDIQLVLCEGLVTNQLYITDGDRISTVYFYFTVNPSLENEVLEESKDKIESLDKLDQLIGVSFDNLEEYEKRLLEFSASMTGIEEAESKRNANELIRSSEELARSTSEEVRINSEEDRVIAENERVANEQERQLSEEDRITNENNRRLAENTRKSQENSRVQAEAERQGIFEENENIRKEQEAKRVQAESTREEKNRTWEEREGIRLISEDQRRESEEARQLAETERDKSEKLREQQENNRQLTYNKFNADEEERISNENIRKTQEDSRNKAELLRQQQEEKRVSAENTRNDSYKASETNRENTFIENENRRQSSYESAELNRNNTFDTEEIKRKNSYQDAENTRNNAFEVNEANRQNEYTAAERLRVENENLRKNNEVARGSNEDERKNNENLRNQSENLRVEEEKARVLAEGKRVEAEQTRVNEFNTMKLENETFKQEINEQYEDIITKNTEFKEQMKTDFGNAKTDYFGEEHLNVVDRLNSDFDNVHQRINDSSYLAYEGTNIKADNSYYGLTKELGLKGRTLQNICPSSFTVNFENDTFGTWKSKFLYLKGFGDVFREETTLEIKPSTTYTIICKVVENTLTSKMALNNFDASSSIIKEHLFINPNETGILKFICNSISDFSILNQTINPVVIRCQNSGAVGKVIINNIMLLEGDYTNTPINEFPFGEGIYSVGENEVTEDGKYPVKIKSYGKNLFKGELELGGYTGTGGTPYQSTTRVRSINKTDIKKGTYTASCGNAIFVGVNIWSNGMYKKELFMNGSYVTFTVDEASSIHIVCESPDLTKSSIQLEEGTVATEYEPYQESIQELELTEPLRSLPNGVADEVLEDGTEIRRVGKVIFDGSESWYPYNSLDTVLRMGSQRLRGLIKNGNGVSANLICDRIKVRSDTSSDTETICCNGNPDIILSLNKSKLQTEDSTGFKQWLQANPVTLYYELAEPIIKKHNKNINLKTFKGTTHIISDNYLQPTISCKVPSNVQAVVMSLKEENEALNDQVSTLNLENENLKTTNDVQDELIDTTMLATDEMYMMIEPLLSEVVQTLSLERSVSKMVDMYVAMVQRGLKTIDEVPARYREQVKEILAQLEK